MCPHRESGRLRAGQNAGRQMDHGGREERSNDPVFRDVGAYVSCRGYVGILLSVWFKPQIKVAPRIICLFVLDRKISVKDFFVWRLIYAAQYF